MQQFMELIRNIGVRDIADMAIVAFVFYKLYMLIRETRAEQLIKGILVLLIATQISDWLQLHVINWILRNTMTVGLIALLIVFQPELRRALEYIGRTKFLTKSIVDIQDEEIRMTVDEIIEAAGSLSRQKIGALVVIERETGLNEVVETGTAINGKISRGLLINIFMPNTPLHDGAVVVRKTEIMAAGCLLPLTDNQNLSKELGTRHRAAIGITERSDSIVVIVSEETGAISMAEKGNLKRFLDIDSLKALLMDAFKSDENRQWQFLKLKWRQKDE
ncbi:diadenylate cyclase CdaA [Alkaliphilus peptidifermentans]|uniref:Diadenylate cyclase n=1 Tax=Alkaliphilus peptidifermentans DSM 18978 TaxID=1120976 RepID=A0A1G5KQD0_9FIRM|nr:diadenylate cyclase CdaA [Alkaliphilus peptidifermentans]SCZ02797.1 diadenylate cyclase [Alkaliphilus peptidifermentans DSM 18978]